MTLENGQPHLKRVHGRADLTVFLIAAPGNLNSVQVVEDSDPAALDFCPGGFLLFVVSQCVAVLERWHAWRITYGLAAPLEAVQE